MIKLKNRTSTVAAERSISNIESLLVKAAEVFLPYIYDLKSGNTLFELVDNGKIKLLN